MTFSLVAHDVRLKLEIIDRALAVHGRKVAADLWAELDLPLPADEKPSTAPPKIISDFLAQAVAPFPGNRVTAQELYDHFSEWAARSGYPPLSLTAFGRGMRRTAVGKVINRKAYYLDIRLSPDPSPGLEFPSVTLANSDSCDSSATV